MPERPAADALLCIGPSHKTASLAARERFALVGAAAGELTAELVQHEHVLEVVSVATCNRSELYLATSDADAVLPDALAAFARLAKAEPQELATMIAVRADAVAVRHLFRVAAGIESVVIGEAQIQGQLKQALEGAHSRQAAGPLLDRLFRRALEVGKQVRSETRIGSGRASVGSVAAELVASRLGDLEGRTVLLVGAGKMSGLAARCLRARGANEIFVANRNADRAAQLAAECDGSVVSFGALERELARCDVVVSSTSAPHLLLTRELLERVAAAREGRPLVLVDLAVPRDIEPSVGAVRGCHLYDLDDLEHVVAETLQIRERELDAATRIADRAAEEFMRWHRSRVADPLITAMRSRAEEIRLAELARFEGRLAGLDDDQRAQVEQLTRGIVNKLLHEPTVRLRERAGADAADATGRDAWMRIAAQLLAPAAEVER